MSVQVNVQGCKSAERVFEVLALFREHRRPMRASFISAKLNYPLSSCAVLLKAIARMGYLSFDSSTHTFFPTPNLYHLGSWLVSPRAADAELVDLAHALFDDSGNSVTLSVRNDAELEFVYSLNADLPLAGVYAGGRMPLQGSVAGLAYLGGLPEAEAIRIIDNVLARTVAGPEVKSAIRARVHKARRLGYACGPTPRFPGLVAFAKCIRVKETHRPLVVAIGSATRDVAQFEDAMRHLLARKLDAYLAH